jgi:hypothetical protein
MILKIRIITVSNNDVYMKINTQYKLSNNIKIFCAYINITDNISTGSIDFLILVSIFRVISQIKSSLWLVIDIL